MNNVPILYPGDKVHIVIPDPGDGGVKAHESLVALYASQGVQVVMTSAVGNLPQFGIVAVFRKPTLIPVEEE